MYDDMRILLVTVGGGRRVDRLQPCQRNGRDGSRSRYLRPGGGAKGKECLISVTSALTGQDKNPLMKIIKKWGDKNHR